MSSATLMAYIGACALSLLLFDRVGHTAPLAGSTSPSSAQISYIERSGDLPIATVVVRPHHYPEVLKFVQAQADHLPLPPTLHQIIQAPEQLIPQPPFLAHIQLDQPLVIALGELMTDQSPDQRVIAVRHRALIPSADPVKLLRGLKMFVPLKGALPADTPVLGGRTDGSAWRVRRDLIIATFPERDHLRVEVASEARGLPTLNEVSRSTWARTPALAALLSEQPTLTAHLKTWRLKDYATQSGYSVMRSAVETVTEPQLKAKLMAMGLAHVLNGELLMSERHLEIDDLTLALQINDRGVQLSSAMSLTPEGARALSVGLSSGATPHLKIQSTPIMTAHLGFDWASTLNEVHELEGVPQERWRSRLRNLTNIARECGPMCPLYVIMRKPMGALKFLQATFATQDPLLISSWLGARVVLTDFNPKSPSGTIALALRADAQPDQVSALLTRAQAGQPSLQVKAHVFPDAQVITAHLGASPMPILSMRGRSKSDPSTPQSVHSTLGELSVNEIGELIKLTPQLQALTPYSAWRVKLRAQLHKRALMWSVWLGEGDAPLLPRAADLETQVNTWSSPIKLRRSSPQDQCVRDLFAQTSTLFRALATANPSQRKTLVVDELPQVIQHLKCARRGSQSRVVTQRLVMPLIEVIGLGVKTEERESYRPFFNDLCALGYPSACTLVNSWQPIVKDSCGLPKLNAGDLILKITPDQDSLDREPVTLEAITAQLKERAVQIRSSKMTETSIAARLLHPDTQPELDVVELDVHPALTMREVKPWIKAVVRAGFTHITLAHRSGALSNDEVQRSMLQIARSAKSQYAREGRVVNAMARPRPNTKHYEYLKVSLSQAQIMVSGHEEAPRALSWGQLPSQGSSLFRGGILLEVNEELPWSQVARVTAQACDGAMIVWPAPRTLSQLASPKPQGISSGITGESRAGLSPFKGFEKSSGLRGDQRDQKMSDINKLVTNPKRVRGDVTAGTPQVEGGRSLKELRRAIKRRRTILRYCYRRQLRRDPTLSGDVVLTLEIAPRGSVTTASIKSSTLNSPQVERCLMGHLKRLKFPKARSESSTTVHYPLTFKAHPSP